MDSLKTPMKAIRAKCLDCSNNQIVEVRECPIKGCPLYPYRMGMHPDTAEKRAKKREEKKAEGNCATKRSESKRDGVECTSFARKATPATRKKVEK